MADASPFPVLVHPYDSPTRNACAYELVDAAAPPSAAPPPARNALVFIGGLGDGPHTVPYIRTIARQLAATDAGRALGYAVFEVRLDSAFSAYGYKRLADDVAGLAAFVRYLRGRGGSGGGRDGKIIFLGHSTGCQDAVAYAAGVQQQSSAGGAGATDDDAATTTIPAVDGYILQGPVSDREAMAPHFPPGAYERTLAAAERMLREGRGDEIMRPEDLPAGMVHSPHTAYRWHSLIAKGGDDDFFSSDLPDARLAAAWGAFAQPVLVLPSADDEHVPKTIDVVRNMARWKAFTRPGLFSDLSGLIPGASHSVEQPDAQLWMAERVMAFLATLAP